MSYHPYDPRMAYDLTQKLSDGDIQDQKPPGWAGSEDKLFCDFAFDSYKEGVEFALKVAELAEEQKHHPDIHIFYSRVRVNFFTHEAGGVTQLDLNGAQAVSRLWEEMKI